MVPQKLSVGIARFAYGGNGGIASEQPAVADWLLRSVLEIKQDERCLDDVWMHTFADTPITMTRNLALRTAKEKRVDLLVMVDSDMHPDLRLRYDPNAKPFWKSSFDFAYSRWQRGPCVIAAPYCGPPPFPGTDGYSPVYVFYWGSYTNNREEGQFKIDKFTREEAAIRSGIEQVAALPTGLCIIDTRICDLLLPPWFDYEWEDKYHSAKASTEDVFFTRNCALQEIPQFVNWDAWAGHVKVWVADKPDLIRVEEIQENYRKALARDVHLGERLIELAPEKTTAEILAALAPTVRLQAERDETWIERSRRELKELIEILKIHGLEVRPQSDFSGQIALGGMLPEEDRQALKNLIAVAGSNGAPLNILEIGSWTGNSAQAFLSALNGRAGVIHCVDTWEGSPNDPTGAICQLLGGPDSLKGIFQANLRDALADGRVVMHQGRSTEVAAAWTAGNLDLIFIDGDHSYEAVKADIESWRRHLVPGGILCGHDYDTPDMPGVARAVDEEFSAQLKVEGNIWSVTPEPVAESHYAD